LRLINHAISKKGYGCKLTWKTTQHYT
jgi:hypothetical protein